MPDRVKQFTFKQDAAKISKNIKAWETAIQNKDFEDASKEEYEDKIVNGKRQVEDMNRKVSTLLGKKQEDNLVTLWKEVQVGIKEVAKAYEFDIVLGYGDPIEKELLDQFQNVNRKMQSMDLGSALPLFVSERVDVSHAVTETLNRWVRMEKKLPKTSPDME